MFVFSPLGEGIVLKPCKVAVVFGKVCHSELYPGFQIMGSSGPLLEKFGGPLLSFGGPADL